MYCQKRYNRLMKIWVQTLVKNEGKWLWYAVSSVAPYVDKILLWDTGSTDESLRIEKELAKEFPGKIELAERKISSPLEFTKVRQEMLEKTLSDWFIVLDGDEIWYEDSIKKVIKTIDLEGGEIESIVVPVVLPVGDMFHRQEDKAGRYKLAGRVGHYNLRAINRRIPGLHSSGKHGVWGWVDGEGRMIQDRDPKKIGYIDAPYFHTTHLERAGEGKDSDVIKRKMKLKYEIGMPFPKDFFYPEVFFRPRPEIVESPWKTMDLEFRFRAFFETPLRKIKRRLWWGKTGY
jgi:glycosyltransferase involved in cell wall biosynthesis